MHKKLIFILLFLALFFHSQVNEDEIKELLKNNPELIESLNIEEGNNASESGKDSSIDKSNKNYLDESDSPIFGFNYIRSIPTSISSTSDLPVPNDYVVSLGDKIRIILTGGKEDIYILDVLMDGSIFFPELGVINVFGDSIKDIRKKIKQLIELSYVGTEVSVSLDSLAAKKINIIGAVKNPGTYIVSPFSTITSSLAYSGGFEDYASLRNIVVKRGQKEIIFDLYDFLIFGSRESDINIQQGDTILIKPTNNFVNISGAVNRPKTYEYIPNDKYSDLINFALGLNKEGNEENMTVTVNKDSKKITERISKSALIGNQVIEALYVGKNISINQKDVFVSGTAVTTGFYQSENQDLTEFLKNLNFSSEIYPFYATYENTISQGLMKNLTAFSLSDPNSYSDLKVTNNTELHFFEREDFLETYQSENNSFEKININDLVSISLPQKNLRIPIKGKVSPRQLHLFFGSPTKINLDKVSVITNKNSFSGSYEMFFDSDELVAISFPSVNESLIEVEVGGEVMNPGKYSISSSTTLYDLYVLAGGLLDNAFEQGIMLFREEVKEKQIKAIREAKSILTDAMLQKSSNLSDKSMVDIESILRLADLVDPDGRVAGEFYEKSESSKAFLLKDGDSIFVPSISYEVVVQGEVLNSSSFIFDESMQFNDYIKAAGGFTDYADKRAVFIIKANGLAISSGNNIFSGQVDIEAGDTIVVPRNLDRLEVVPAISMATKIIADIAFSAASLNAIQN